MLHVFGMEKHLLWRVCKMRVHSTPAHITLDISSVFVSLVVEASHKPVWQNNRSAAYTPLCLFIFKTKRELQDNAWLKNLWKLIVCTFQVFHTHGTEAVHLLWPWKPNLGCFWYWHYDNVCMHEHIFSSFPFVFSCFEGPHESISLNTNIITTIFQFTQAGMIV